MPTYSIVIPVYNGATSIEELVRELAALDLPGGVELVLVNDCSPDNSWEIIERISRKAPMPIIALDLAKNFGEHNAVMAGYSVCSGDYIINIDDDFQNPPSEVVKLFQYAKAHPELDVVYTYYPHKFHSFFRNAGSRFNDMIATRLLNKPKGLYLSSFRCLNRFVLERILLYQGPYPYIDGLVLQNTKHIGRMEVQHAARKGGNSGYSIRKLVRLFLTMFVNFSVMPLRLASIMGVIFSCVGFLLAVSAIAESVLHNTPQGWASVLAAVVIFSGIQLLMLGLIGEYIGRIFLVQQGKPQYAIRTVLEPNDQGR